MKSLFACILLASSVSFAAISPLKFIEKSSGKISALIKRGTVDNSFLTQAYKATVKTKAGGAGAVVVIYSSSTNEALPNTLTMSFDAAANMLASSTSFTAANPVKTVFPKANADELLNVGPKYIKGSQDQQIVAQLTKEVTFVNENGQIKMDIHLIDFRVYQVVMDLDGKLISKGMKN